MLGKSPPRELEVAGSMDYEQASVDSFDSASRAVAEMLTVCVYSMRSCVVYYIYIYIYIYIHQGWGKALSNSLSLKHKHLQIFKHKHYPGIHDLS